MLYTGSLSEFKASIMVERQRYYSSLRQQGRAEADLVRVARRFLPRQTQPEG